MLSEELVQTFQRLMAEAEAAGETDANAMSLATAQADGRVSSRIVLMKQLDARGFVFYTNLDSDKGRQLRAHPRAALCFHWKKLRDGVQVRVEGRVETVADAEADAYFASRPRESQLGAWASLQSQTLPDRGTFEARYAEAEQRYANAPVPRPPHWSGQRVVPDLIEFWYGVPFRLHERHRHEWRDGAWQFRLLYP
jgi:pyridoxamine 5'-phosphate oxidase